MSHWFQLLPVQHDQIRAPGVPARKRKRSPGERTVNHRRISQETVRAARAEYDALPKHKDGRAHHGATEAIAAKHGVSVNYLRGLVRRGLRDDEREPPQ